MKTDTHIEFDLLLLNNLFYVNQNSKTGLSYAKDRYSGNGRLMAKKGSDAGGRLPSKSHGYYVVNVDGKPRLVHRIIYTIGYGQIPKGMFVDHINGNRTDNSLSNLRLVDRKTNQRNRKMSSNNTTGFVGVSRVNRKYSPYYCAQWLNEYGDIKTKVFTITKYGEEEALRLAIEFRKSKIMEMNILGENYTERHFLGENQN